MRVRYGLTFNVHISQRKIKMSWIYYIHDDDEIDVSSEKMKGDVQLGV